MNQYLLTKKSKFDNGNLLIKTGIVKSPVLKGFELEIDEIFRN